MVDVSSYMYIEHDNGDIKCHLIEPEIGKNFNALGQLEEN